MTSGSPVVPPVVLRMVGSGGTVEARSSWAARASWRVRSGRRTEVLGPADVVGPQPGLVEAPPVVRHVVVGVAQERGQLAALEGQQLAGPGALEPAQPIQPRQGRPPAHAALPGRDQHASHQGAVEIHVDQAAARARSATGGGGMTWSRYCPGSPVCPSMAAIAMLYISRAVT